MATPRRTQEERSTTTRNALLDATIECLVEYGYTGTTVTRVAERAHVTRGAQVHHFATKELLVLSAVRHLNEIRSAETLALMETFAGGKDVAERMLDLLWESHRGPVFVATAEMWIAGRTNPQLAEHEAEVEEVVRVEFGNSRKANAEFRDAVFTAMDAMRGLVMSSWHLPEKDVQARWRRLKKHLLLIFQSANATNGS